MDIVLAAVNVGGNAFDAVTIIVVVVEVINAVDWD